MSRSRDNLRTKRRRRARQEAWGADACRARWRRVYRAAKQEMLTDAETARWLASGEIRERPTRGRRGNGRKRRSAFGQWRRRIARSGFRALKAMVERPTLLEALRGAR